MKNIILPNKELQLLANQLQNFQTGYTVQQIRSLDKVIRTIEEQLKPFTDGLKKILETPIEGSTPEDKAKNEEKKQKAVEEYMKTKGSEKLTCTLEDTDMEFVRLIWSRMASLNGQREARETIIKIDDAIQGASAPVFTNGETKKPEEPILN